MNLKNYIQTKLSKPGKEPRVRMPNWERPETRPFQGSIVPWEVYGSSHYNEHQIIKGLQELRVESKVDTFIRNNTTWWCTKE